MQLLYCLGWILLGAVLSAIWPPLIGSNYGWLGTTLGVIGGFAVIGGCIGLAIIVIGNLVRVACGNCAHGG